jgi:hypothetical protein
MKKFIIISLAVYSTSVFAQKVKTDNIPVFCTILPKTTLPGDHLTYSCVVLENPLNTQQKTTSMGVTMDWNFETANLISGFSEIAPSVKRSIAITIRTEEFGFQKTVSQQQTTNATTGANEINYTYDIKPHYEINACAVLDNGDTVMKVTCNEGPGLSLNYPYNIQPTGAMEIFKTSGQLESNFNSKLNDIKILARKQCSLDFLQYLKDTLNSMVGYPSEKLFFEIASAKSKSFSYADLDSAMDFMKQAMDSVSTHCKKNIYNNWSFNSSYSLVRKSVSIWEKALTEESKEKNSRVTPELAAYIRQNLAYGYLMLDEYDKSAAMFTKCETDEELSKSAKRNCSFFMATFFPKFKERFKIHEQDLKN